MGLRAAAAATLIGLGAAAQATDYNEGAVLTGTYLDTTSKPAFSGTSGTCAFVSGVGTCTYSTEANDLSSSAHVGQTVSPTPANPSPHDNGTTNIGALTVGSNTITGASLPYGAIANAMTNERQYQDSDYVTFTVPTGDVLSSIYLMANGSSINAGDQAFIGLASGANVYVNLPSSAGLLGYTLLNSSQIGSTNILPLIGAANPAGFDSTAVDANGNPSPFAGATRFTGPLQAGTYTLWLLDGDNDFHYNLNLGVSQAPEPASWLMMIAGFGLVGGAMRRQRRTAPAVA